MATAWRSSMFSYLPLKRIGSGSFGEVHLARVLETGELVALKAIFVRASDKGLPDNVVREVMCLRAVQDEHVIALKEVFAKGNSMVLVLEYCALDLADLHKTVRRNLKVVADAAARAASMAEHQQAQEKSAARAQLAEQREQALQALRAGSVSQPTDSPASQPLPISSPQGMSPPRFVTMAQPHSAAAAGPLLSQPVIKALIQHVLRGLAACHEAGILHRDLKLNNVLLTHTGIAKVADFGLARPHNGGQRPCYTHTVATRWYRAPELLYGARCYGPGVDLWAAGVLFAELLAGSPFIPGDGDISQLSLTISMLGSVETSWPGVIETPDFKKVTFPLSVGTPLPVLLPMASPSALHLLEGLIRYDPEKRTPASVALHDPYFSSEPLPSTQQELAQVVLDALQMQAASRARDRLEQGHGQGSDHSGSLGGGSSYAETSSPDGAL